MRGAIADGEAIRRERCAKEWSQEVLASEAGCSTRTVRNAENGERVDPRTLSLLAEALGTSLKMLLNENATSYSQEELHVRGAKEWTDAFRAANVDRLILLHHPDTQLELPGTEGLPAGGGAQGVDELRLHYEQVFSLVLPLSVSDQTYDAVGRLVFHRSTLSLQNRETGYVFTTRYLNEFEFQDGLILRRLTISDLSEHRRSFNNE